MNEEKRCPRCDTEMNKYCYVNAGDYSKELFKTKNGKTYFNITQWKYICPKCEYFEIIKMTEEEIERIDEYVKKLKGGGAE